MTYKQILLCTLLTYSLVLSQIPPPSESQTPSIPIPIQILPVPPTAPSNIPPLINPITISIKPSRYNSIILAPTLFIPTETNLFPLVGFNPNYQVEGLPNWGQFSTRNDTISLNVPEGWNQNITINITFSDPRNNSGSVSITLGANNVEKTKQNYSMKAIEAGHREQNTCTLGYPIYNNPSLRNLTAIRYIPSNAFLIDQSVVPWTTLIKLTLSSQQIDEGANTTQTGTGQNNQTLVLPVPLIEPNSLTIQSNESVNPAPVNASAGLTPIHNQGLNPFVPVDLPPSPPHHPFEQIKPLQFNNLSNDNWPNPTQNNNFNTAPPLQNNNHNLHPQPPLNPNHLSNPSQHNQNYPIFNNQFWNTPPSPSHPSSQPLPPPPPPPLTPVPPTPHPSSNISNTSNTNTPSQNPISQNNTFIFSQSSNQQSLSLQPLPIKTNSSTPPTPQNSKVQTIQQPQILTFPPLPDIHPIPAQNNVLPQNISAPSLVTQNKTELTNIHNQSIVSPPIDQPQSNTSQTIINITQPIVPLVPIEPTKPTSHVQQTDSSFVSPPIVNHQVQNNISTIPHQSIIPVSPPKQSINTSHNTPIQSQNKVLSVSDINLTTSAHQPSNTLIVPNIPVTEATHTDLTTQIVTPIVVPPQNVSTQAASQSIGAVPVSNPVASPASNPVPIVRPGEVPHSNPTSTPPASSTNSSTIIVDTTSVAIVPIVTPNITQTHTVAATILPVQNISQTHPQTIPSAIIPVSTITPVPTPVPVITPSVPINAQSLHSSEQNKNNTVKVIDTANHTQQNNSLILQPHVQTITTIPTSTVTQTTTTTASTTTVLPPSNNISTATKQTKSQPPHKDNETVSPVTQSIKQITPITIPEPFDFSSFNFSISQTISPIALQMPEREPVSQLGLQIPLTTATPITVTPPAPSFVENPPVSLVPELNATKLDLPLKQSPPKNNPSTISAIKSTTTTTTVTVPSKEAPAHNSPTPVIAVPTTAQQTNAKKAE